GVAPRIADRTGTAVRPRPGSSAMRTPTPAEGEIDERRTAFASTEGRSAAAARPRAAIRAACHAGNVAIKTVRPRMAPAPSRSTGTSARSEEHTSELQSLAYLVCRLLLEKKK